MATLDQHKGVPTGAPLLFHHLQPETVQLFLQ